MRRLRKAPLWLVLVVLALVAAGGTVVAARAFTTDEGPTRSEYVARVDAICARYGARLDQVPPPGDLSSPGAIVESLQGALPILREQEEAIRALPAPRALDADLAELFRLTDRSLEELQNALDAALERALFPMATALTRFGDVRNEAKVISRRIGFHC